jgi:type II secretory pathway component PulC
VVVNIRKNICRLTAKGFGLALTILSAASIADELRDPTTPLDQVKEIESHIDLVLYGISDVGNRRFAIINDRRVYQGDILNGAKIEEINGKQVIYSYKGKSYTMNMHASLNQ